MKQKMLLLFTLLVSTIFTMPPERPHFYETNPYQLNLWGCYNQLEKKPVIVKECYDALIHENCNIFAYSGYINYLFSTKQYEAIVRLIPKIDSALSDHIETQLTLVKALELVGRQKDAETKIIALQKNFKTHPEVTYSCALAYIRNKQTKDAVEVIDHFLQSTTEKQMHFIFYYLKAQAAINENNKEQARASIVKCLELNPAFDQGWLLSGLLHELEGNLEDAISGYKNFLQLVGHDTAVEQQVMTLMLKQQQPTAAPTEIRQMFEESLMLYRQHQSCHALKRIEHCLQLNPSYRPARLLKIELLCALHQPDQAIKQLHEWIHHEPKEDIWYRAAHLLYQANLDKDAILAMFEHLEKKNNHNILPLIYLADIHLKRKDSDKASTYLKKALAVSTNKQLKAKITYQLAVLYFNNKDYDTLAQVLEHGLALQEDFAPLLNLAAYYYATKGKNIKKAQTLLDNVLKMHQDNPHYQDTQAVIWYKQGEYQKAHSLLVKLTNQEPKDFYIQKHLSKTFFKQGNHQQAISTMKKALICSHSEVQKTKCHKLINHWSAQKSL